MCHPLPQTGPLAPRQVEAVERKGGEIVKKDIHIRSCSVSLLSAFIFVSSLFWGQAKPENAAVGSATGSPTAAASKAASAMPHDDSFVIGNDDVLSINVWKEPDISRSIPVRSDGKISLPLAGEVQAAGLTPLKLEQEIANKLQSFISQPEVTVMVQQINSEKFNVLGQVAHPGTFVLSNSPTVLDAIALAGGFRDFAKQKAIYILRQNADGSQMRIPFNYKQVVKGENPAQNIKLQARDTVVVP
jgi:polysaccharide biosynthesis/export protein